MKAILAMDVTGYVVAVAAALLLRPGDATAQATNGVYHVYYGHLHNHCNVSDGKGKPLDAYVYARDKGKLDFFGLADHDHSLTPAKWGQMKAAADACNQDGVFVTFRGFEWTDNTLGHVAVVGSQDYCRTLVTNAPESAIDTFEKLRDWVDARGCVAFFNHPGYYDRKKNGVEGQEFSHFTSPPSGKFVGMELWNKQDLFRKYYYRDGYYANDGKIGWIDEANTRGWRVGASGSEDNHAGTWGTAGDARVAVWATAKTRDAIMKAFQARRFYSTSDKNLALSFQIDGQEMGSTLPKAGEYACQILASDADQEGFTAVELLKKGVVIQSWVADTNAASLKITGTVSCSAGDYYYVRVRQADAGEAITSPIWVGEGPAISSGQRATGDRLE